MKWRSSSVLVVCILTLVASAAVVPAAHAIEWSIEGTELVDAEPGGESISSTGEAFELNAPEIGLAITCKSESGTGEIVEEGFSSALITLSGCEVSGGGCTVKSPGKSTGTLTATLEGKIVVEEVSEEVTTTYNELAPKMTIESLGECSFPKELKMQGQTAAEVPHVGTESSTRSQKFSKTITEQSGVESLSLGESPAYFTGTIVEELSGAHAEEQLGTFFFWARPRSLSFAGGVGAAFAQTVTITNLSATMEIKIIAITLFSGNYTINEPMPTCKGLKVGASESCQVSVICNETPNNGMFEVEADLLDANGNIYKSDGRQVTMTC